MDPIYEAHLKAVYNGRLPAEMTAVMLDAQRHETYKPYFGDRDEYGEALKDNGLPKVEHRTVMRLNAEQWMANLDEHMLGHKSMYREIAEKAVPRLRGVGALEGMLGESTGVDDIERFRNFLFGIIHDLGPALAPLASMFGIHSSPIPEAKIAHLKSWGDTDSTYYTEPWRLRDNVDKTYPEWDCGTRANEVKFTVDMSTITTLVYALLAEIDLCADQDAKSQYGINLDAQARQTIAYYMARATCRRVFDTAYGAAAGGSATWTSSAAAGSIYTLDSFGDRNYLRTLPDYMDDVNLAVRGNRFQSLNWWWVANNVENMLGKTNVSQYAQNADGRGGVIQPALEFTKNVGGKYDIIVDDDLPDNSCLGGRRPDTWDNTSLAIVIYVPLMFVPADAVPFIDPKEVLYRRVGITRQGIHTEDAYRLGKVVIT